jgi:hypothetical protein
LVEVDDRQKVRLDLWCSTHALSDIAPAKKFQTKIVFQQTAKLPCLPVPDALRCPTPRRVPLVVKKFANTCQHFSCQNAVFMRRADFF